MGMDASFLKYPKSEYNRETDAKDENFADSRVSPYEPIYIDALEYLHNERELDKLLVDFVQDRYDMEFRNSAYYQIAEVDVRLLIHRNANSEHYSSRVEQILQELLADMIKSRYKDVEIYDYYYTSNW